MVDVRAKLRELFSENVDDASIERLAEAVSVKDYPARTFLCKQGDPATEVYILVSGTVGVYIKFRNETFQIDVIEQGIFGEIGFLLSRTRTASIICREATTVLEIDGRSFRAIAKEIPQLAVEMSQIVLRRLIEQDNQQIIKLRHESRIAAERQSHTTYNLINRTNMVEQLLNDIGLETFFEVLFSRLGPYGAPIQHPELHNDVLLLAPDTPSGSRLFEFLQINTTKLNLAVRRAGDIFPRQQVMMANWSMLHAAQIVICDCTGRDPSVLYELGIAHTLGKPIIYITQNPDDVPTDIQGLPIIVYEDSNTGMSELFKRLRKALHEAQREQEDLGEA